MHVTLAAFWDIVLLIVFFASIGAMFGFLFVYISRIIKGRLL